MLAVAGWEAVPEASGVVPLAYRMLMRYLCGMDDKGYKRTSVHMPADLVPRVEAAFRDEGLKPADLMRKGLDAEPLENMIRRVIREELAAALGNGAKAHPASPVAVPFREPGQ